VVGKVTLDTSKGSLRFAIVTGDMAARRACPLSALCIPALKDGVFRAIGINFVPFPFTMPTKIILDIVY
jgi:hypothetical protein